jgi:hypothetical protein
MVEEGRINFNLGLNNHNSNLTQKVLMVGDHLNRTLLVQKGVVMVLLETMLEVQEVEAIMPLQQILQQTMLVGEVHIPLAKQPSVVSFRVLDHNMVVVQEIILLNDQHIVVIVEEEVTLLLLSINNPILAAMQVMQEIRVAGHVN